MESFIIFQPITQILRWGGRIAPPPPAITYPQNSPAIIGLREFQTTWFYASLFNESVIGVKKFSYDPVDQSENWKRSLSHPGLPSFQIELEERPALWQAQLYKTTIWSSKKCIGMHEWNDSVCTPTIPHKEINVQKSGVCFNALYGCISLRDTTSHREISKICIAC